MKKKENFIVRINKLNIYKLSALLSILAILLSQFPPIYSFFQKPKIEIRSDLNQIAIFHNFGKLRMQNWIQLKNDGWASESITDIYLYLEKKDSSMIYKILRAENEIDLEATENLTKYIPVFDIYLLPGTYLFTQIGFSELINSISKNCAKPLDHFVIHCKIVT